MRSFWRASNQKGRPAVSQKIDEFMDWYQTKLIVKEEQDALKSGRAGALLGTVAACPVQRRSSPSLQPPAALSADQA